MMDRKLNRLQIEINMFLRATEMNPSSINCGGFFDVNRNLFKSVGSAKSLSTLALCYSNFIFDRLQLLTTMVTYLVVLLQFQISIPDDSSQFMLNATMPSNVTDLSKGT